jgi:hypothetical protein
MNIDLAAELCDSEVVQLTLLSNEQSKMIKRIFDVDADMIMLFKEKEGKK